MTPPETESLARIDLSPTEAGCQMALPSAPKSQHILEKEKEEEVNLNMAVNLKT